MEQKNRLLISFAVIALVVFAMFTSFGRSLFLLNTPSVELPAPDTSVGDSASGTSSAAGQYQRLEVTPGTVQNVVATLSRADSYYRELLVETFWAEGSSAIPVQIWVDSGASHCVQTLPSGAIRHDLVANDMLYYWYEGSRQYLSAPADGQSADLAQHIPTYETVLDLDPDTITAAGYEQKDGLPCVYVEARAADPALTERYWISTDVGLLMAAELLENGETVYRLSTTSSVTAPCPSTASFALPDGTPLSITP